MAKEPVLAPKVTTSWGIDHYAALEAGESSPVQAPVETPVEAPVVEEVVEDVE
jgi:hypothetical protein